jgi:hypothetical protein
MREIECHSGAIGKAAAGPSERNPGVGEAAQCVHGLSVIAHIALAVASSGSLIDLPSTHEPVCKTTLRQTIHRTTSVSSMNIRLTR